MLCLYEDAPTHVSFFWTVLPAVLLLNMCKFGTRPDGNSAKRRTGWLCRKNGGATS